MTEAPQPVDLPVGADLVGRYRLQAIVQSDPLTITYRAADIVTGGTVLLRIAGPSAGEPGRRRLREAARRTGLVSNTSVLQPAHFDESGEWAYLVRDWIDAPTLADALAGGSGIGQQELGRLALVLCDVIESFHEQGVTVGNLCPGNVILVSDSDGGPAHARILDAGITPLPANSDPYQSPRVRSGEQPGRQDDLFSLGVVLFACLGIEPDIPFDTLGSARVLRDRDVRAAVLSRVLAQLTAPRPIDQFSGIATARDALIEAFIAWRPEPAIDSTSPIVAVVQDPEAPDGGDFPPPVDELPPPVTEPPTEARSIRQTTVPIAVAPIVEPALASARVAVRVAPAGSLVYWDDTYVGDTAVELTEYEFGRHAIRIEHPELPPVEREVTVERGVDLAIEMVAVPVVEPVEVVAEEPIDPAMELAPGEAPVSGPSARLGLAALGTGALMLGLGVAFSSPPLELAGLTTLLGGTGALFAR